MRSAVLHIDYRPLSCTHPPACSAGSVSVRYTGRSRKIVGYLAIGCQLLSLPNRIYSLPSTVYRVNHFKNSRPGAKVLLLSSPGGSHKGFALVQTSTRVKPFPGSHRGLSTTTMNSKRGEKEGENPLWLRSEGATRERGRPMREANEFFLLSR